MEPENPTDVYVFAVMANCIVVGQVLRKISAACSLLLCWNESTIHLENLINGLYVGGI